MKTPARLLCLLACLPTGVAFGADFDGSKPLICAAQEARDCVSGYQCDSGLPDEFALPTFMRVDIAKKTIAGPNRTTAIQSMETGTNQILLQGTELGYAWSFALDTNDGAMTGTITNRDGVFVVFGACTPL